MCSFLDLLNIFNTMFDFKYLCLGLFLDIYSYFLTVQKLIKELNC